MERGTTRRSLLRRLMFNLLMILGTWLIIEVCSLVAMLMFFGPPSLLTMQRRVAAGQNPFQPGGYFKAPDVIHPYIGSVMETKDDDGALTIDDKYRVTEYGFTDTALPIHKRSSDKVIVGILGGSVARQLSLNATDLLAEELSPSPAFAGKTFQFVRLANNGYKQPQQLMTINYLLTLGAEFDIIINLDGVNEAALPGADNVPFGVFSAYPRDWGKLVAGTTSPEFVRRSGYLSHLRQEQRNVAIWYDRIPWRYSPTAQMVCSARLNRFEQMITAQLGEMSKFSEKELTYCSSGPPEHFDKESDLYEHCAQIWFRSSVMLHQLCTSRGIRYFHFLQPNQYLQGSKPIGAVEAAIALDEKSPMCHGVRAGLPLMQAKASELEAAGVEFTDLTKVFAEHPEPIYKDACCHVKLEGDLILAKAIAARIRQAGEKLP